MAKDFSKTLGQGLLKDVAAKTNSMMDTQNIVALPIEEIHENPDNRKIFTMDHIDRLADTIEDEGFWGAIEVIKIGDNNYEISSGHRRYAAMKQLGKKNIPCIIIPDMSAEDKAKRLLSSNLNNRELTPLIYGRMIDYYRKEVLEKNGEIPKGGWRKEAAKFFDISETQVYRLIKLSSLIPELQHLAEIPQFPWTRLENVAPLSPEIQKEIYDEIEADHALHPEDDYSSARVRQIIERVRDKHTNVKKLKAPEPTRDTTFDISASTTSADFSTPVVDSFSDPVKMDPDKKSPLRDLSAINDHYSTDGKKPFGDEYNTKSIAETLPIMNPPKAKAQEHDDTLPVQTKVPFEVYIDESISQLRLASNADLTNTEIITEKLDELTDLINTIKQSL